MHIHHLQLQDFRGFPRLNLDLTPGPTLLIGGNAEGKTTLLEGVHLLSTIRSPLAEADADFIRWDAQSAPDPFARLSAAVERHSGSLKVELAILGHWEDDVLHARKAVRVNGLPRRTSEAMGQLTSVFFTADDLDLVQGTPSLRRRYLDITISQVDKAYLRTLQRYHKVLEQRNHLLRHIKEVRAHPDELDYWNEALVREGSYIIQARARVVAGLSMAAAQTYDALSGGREALAVLYKPQAGPALNDEALGYMELADIAVALNNGLKAWQPREFGAGVSLLGPHRDDLLFQLGGKAASAFASRAQQRSIALSLRLAEAGYLWEQGGESPVLLLDDILSELDRARRSAVLTAIEPFEQVLLTATEGEHFSPAFLDRASLFTVQEGEVAPLPSVRLSAG